MIFNTKEKIHEYSFLRIMGLKEILDSIPPMHA
jgi:hypothetical protein